MKQFKRDNQAGPRNPLSPRHHARRRQSLHRPRRRHHSNRNRPFTALSPRHLLLCLAKRYEFIRLLLRRGQGPPANQDRPHHHRSRLLLQGHRRRHPPRLPRQPAPPPRAPSPTAKPSMATHSQPFHPQPRLQPTYPRRPRRLYQPLCCPTRSLPFPRSATALHR